MKKENIISFLKTVVQTWFSVDIKEDNSIELFADNHADLAGVLEVEFDSDKFFAKCQAIEDAINTMFNIQNREDFYRVGVFEGSDILKALDGEIDIDELTIEEFNWLREYYYNLT